MCGTIGVPDSPVPQQCAAGTKETPDRIQTLICDLLEVYLVLQKHGIKFEIIFPDENTQFELLVGFVSQKDRLFAGLL